MEPFNKLDAIAMILTSACKSCDCQEMYSKFQTRITPSEMMKFVFELKKYNLLKPLNNDNNIIITPKGMQYLQIHKELTDQINSEITTNSGIFHRLIPFSRFINLFKNKSY